MTNYVNNHGLLCFTIEKKDYVFRKGETLGLPESDSHVKMLVARKYIEAVTTGKKSSTASTAETTS
jgi:hypothetical protein